MQEELVESIEDAGFDGRLLGQGTEKGTARLHVDGMLCSACRCVELITTILPFPQLALLDRPTQIKMLSALYGQASSEVSGEPAAAGSALIRSRISDWSVPFLQRQD